MSRGFFYVLKGSIFTEKPAFVCTDTDNGIENIKLTPIPIAIGTNP